MTNKNLYGFKIKGLAYVFKMSIFKKLSIVLYRVYTGTCICS